MPETFGHSDDSVLSGYPYAILSLQLEDGETPVEGLVSRYGLVLEKSLVKDVVHVRVREPKPGCHKLDSVFLFAFALELSARLPNVRLYLHESDPLRDELDRQLHVGGPVFTDFDRRIAEWLETQVQLSVEARVTTYLQQAGYPLDREEYRLDLAPYYVRGLRRVVHESALEIRELRKAGER